MLRLSLLASGAERPASQRQVPIHDMDLDSRRRRAEATAQTPRIRQTAPGHPCAKAFRLGGNRRYRLFSWKSRSGFGKNGVRANTRRCARLIDALQPAITRADCALYCGKCEPLRLASRRLRRAFEMRTYIEQEAMRALTPTGGFLRGFAYSYTPSRSSCSTAWSFFAMPAGAW